MQCLLSKGPFSDDSFGFKHIEPRLSDKRQLGWTAGLSFVYNSPIGHNTDANWVVLNSTSQENKGIDFKSTKSVY
jgi:hypothetical protein